MVLRIESEWHGHSVPFLPACVVSRLRASFFTVHRGCMAFKWMDSARHSSVTADAPACSLDDEQRLPAKLTDTDLGEPPPILGNWCERMRSLMLTRA